MRRERSVFALTSAIGCAIVIFLSIGVAGMFSLFIPEYMAEYGYSKMEMSYVAMVATVSGFLFSLIGSTRWDPRSPCWWGPLPPRCSSA